MLSQEKLASLSYETAREYFQLYGTPEDIAILDNLFKEKKPMQPISTIALEIKRTWPKVNFAAVPYLNAMTQMNTIKDPSGADDGHMIVRYFLSNAATWRGEDAKRIKAELNAMLKAA